MVNAKYVKINEKSVTIERDGKAEEVACDSYLYAALLYGQQVFY